MKWAEKELQFLRENYDKMTHAEISFTLGRSINSVRNQCYELGLKKSVYKHDDKMLAAIRRAYEQAGECGIDLYRLSEQLGVTRHWISRQAKYMGFSNIQRSKTSEARAASGVSVSRWIKENGHPKGMKGRCHSVETRKRLSETSTDSWNSLSKKEQDARVDQGIKTRHKNGTLIQGNRHKASWKQGWYKIGGVSCFFRSSWEVNYARYLEWLKQRGEIIEWEYEPTTFWFYKIKRGARSYTPDFRVTEKDGGVKYHEVKGWMDRRSKTKLKRMKKYHPEVDLVLVDAQAYRKLRRQILGLVPEIT